MRYVVARVITSPTGAVRTARLLVTDVPERTSPEQVLAALEAAGLAAEFSEAGVPFGNHEIKADGRRGWPYGISGVREAEAVKWAGPPDKRPEPAAIAWADLTRERGRNEGRRVTLRLTDAEHARYSLAAGREGASLQEWFVRAADAQAEREALARGEHPAAPARKLAQAAAEAAS
jgi:hypothetical protein